jgi:hypothetical protein
MERIILGVEVISAIDQLIAIIVIVALEIQNHENIEEIIMKICRLKELLNEQILTQFTQ